jgi:hypothetical protein
MCVHISMAFEWAAINSIVLTGSLGGPYVNDFKVHEAMIT